MACSLQFLVDNEVPLVIYGWSKAWKSRSSRRNRKEQCTPTEVTDKDIIG